jgi:23S rRNA (cytidine1920-2'-O)/16S rRNA (cytidine1409-2'-O)-methyltransferase
MNPRLDELMLSLGLVPTRAKAQGMIMAGVVKVDGEVCSKAGKRVDPAAAIEVVANPVPYVGRGGLKLAGALDAFGLDPSGWIAADIGSSTGGFTDVLLQRGATRVYAVDVGRGLLDWSLRNDHRVVVLEGVNARHLTGAQIPEPLDAAVMDCSFISVKLLLPPLLPLLKAGGLVIPMIKPQFEVGKGRVGKGGIVRDQHDIDAAVEGVRGFAAGLGLAILGSAESPITGAKGNREFFLHLRRPSEPG